MSRRLRDIRVIGIVEDVESSRDRVVGVPTDRTDVLGVFRVGFEILRSIHRLADGHVGRRQVNHTSDTTVRLGVDPTGVSLGSIDRESGSDRDVLRRFLDDGGCSALSERARQAREVVCVCVDKRSERLVACTTQSLIDGLGDHAQHGEVSAVLVVIAPERFGDDLGLWALRGDAGNGRTLPTPPLDSEDPAVHTLVDEVGGLLIAEVDVVAYPEGDSLDRDLASFAPKKSPDEVAQDGLFVGLVLGLVNCS